MFLVNPMDNNDLLWPYMTVVGADLTDLRPVADLFASTEDMPTCTFSSCVNAASINVPVGNAVFRRVIPWLSSIITRWLRKRRSSDRSTVFVAR